MDNALARGGVMMDTVRLCPAVAAAAARVRNGSPERQEGVTITLVSDATEDGSKGYLLSHTAPKEEKIA